MAPMKGPFSCYIFFPPPASSHVVVHMMMHMVVHMVMRVMVRHRLFFCACD
jgi:hypothetical protein